MAPTRGSWLDTLNDHVARLRALGFDEEMITTFSKEWGAFEKDGYEMYGLYTGASGSDREGKSSCIICSKKSDGLQWHKVTTPSMDSAALYSVCQECDSVYVETALKQKALGRLLKERNTRPT